MEIFSLATVCEIETVIIFVLFVCVCSLFWSHSLLAPLCFAGKNLDKEILQEHFISTVVLDAGKK